MTWTNNTGSDVAFEIRCRYGMKQRVRGPYRLRSNVERELSHLPGCTDWEIAETVFACRCDDEYHETSEAEWYK